MSGIGKPFLPGREKTGGRAKGARNKLSQAFLEAFAADFEQHGAEVIKIVRIERPSDYLKTAAYLMPKELEITETKLMEIPDDELDAFIEFAQRRIAERALQSEKQRRLTENRLTLLQAIRQTKRVSGQDSAGAAIYGR